MLRPAVAAALVLFSAVASSAAEPVDYLRDIKPVLKARCFACHGALKQKAKLRVDTVAAMKTGGKYGEVIVAGDPAGSTLIERISDPDESSRMPPEGKPLTTEQIAAFKQWIQQGARAPANERPEPDPKDHWAFHAPKRPSVPSSKFQVPSNPIDAFLAAEREKRGLSAAPPTDKATLLRRVYLDLIGLPPTRPELAAFLADESPDAYEKVVDKLLASPRYGERWARHWMDVWRYSDWYGRRSVPDVLNSYAQVWRWRDWIVRSVNADRPYDWMVRMMLAADELVPGDDANVVATGYLVRNFFRWNYNNWMRDNVEHTGKAFLGLTFNCCHCHDHKYDPITQEEYFKFRAFFEPLEIQHVRWPGEPDPGPYPKYKYGAAYKPITSGMVRVFDEKPDAKTFFYTGGDERNKVKGRAPVPPGAPAALGGASLKVAPVKLPPEAWYPGMKPFIRAEETKKRAGTVAQAKAALETAKVKARPAPLKKLVGILPGLVIAAEPALAPPRRDAVKVAAAKLAAAKAELAALGARIAADDAAYRVSKPSPAAPATLAKCPPLSPVYPRVSSGRRAALAKWITSRDNPLTARVAVNHVWGWYFGRPLVETTNNFGRSGKMPSHPALLDWLACELMDHGWQTKHLHRLIVTSQAYRMNSRGASANRASDPDNVYLWRFPTQRMEAEVVRDSILHASGQLDLTAFGPELPQEQGPTSHRRSIWFSHHGEARMLFLELFDEANPCDAYRRTTSVLPQQALALSNSDLIHRQSRVLAQSLADTSGDEFIRAAFEQVLSRPPRGAELAASRKFLARQVKLLSDSKVSLKPGQPADPAARARADLVQALFNHTDFVTIR
jgi:hypothetical protein